MGISIESTLKSLISESLLSPINLNFSLQIKIQSVVLALDLIDRGIMLDLRRNCRISYKTLAENHNISSNAIKNRIDGLTKSGVLDRYFIQLSRAMVNSEFMFVLLYTDKSIDDDTFSELVFKLIKFIFKFIKLG